MIVIPSSLVITPTDDINSDNPVIGYQNKVTTGNIAATTADASHPVTNLANPATYSQAAWLATNTSTVYLTCTLAGNTDDINYVGLAGHNLGTVGASVSVEGDTGSGYSTIAGPQIQSDDSPMIFRFTTAAYTAIRVKILTPTAAPRVAVMYVGALLTLQRRLYVGHSPITMGRSRDVRNGMSEGGNFTGRIVVGGQTSTGISLQNLTASWYRSYMDPFIKAAETTPFFFAWRPNTYPKEVGYAWLTSNPIPKNQRSNGMMQVDLSMTGIIS